MIPKMTSNTKILSLVFILSLGLNVALVGFGLAIAYKTQHKTVEQQAEQHLESVLRFIPESSRDNVREQMKSTLDKVEDNLKEIRAERKKIAELLAAETIDNAAVKASFARIRDLTSASQKLYQDAMVEAAGKLPQEERQKMAENLKKHHRQEE